MYRWDIYEGYKKSSRTFSPWFSVMKTMEKVAQWTRKYTKKVHTPKIWQIFLPPKSILHNFPIFSLGWKKKMDTLVHEITLLIIFSVEKCFLWSRAFSILSNSFPICYFNYYVDIPYMTKQFGTTYSCSSAFHEAWNRP